MHRTQNRAKKTRSIQREQAMKETMSKGAARALCWCALVAASAGCTAREPVADAGRIDAANDAATESSGASATVAPPPAAQGNETVTKPSQPSQPPAKQPAVPPRPDVQPSPWQPPAEIDPVPPDVGNAT